jgi:glucose-1-phosphate thymidylyltransferase
MRAFIPVAGVGSKLKPHTYTQPKALIHVAGKPILGHIIDKLKQSGIHDIVFIIGYMGDKIQRYVEHEHTDITATFVLQSDGLGTAHALWLAKEMIPENEAFLIIFGDTIVEADFTPILEAKESLLGVKKVDDPRLFGVAELDDRGVIKNLVEKPSIPKSNLALIGMYKISESDLFKKALVQIHEQGFDGKKEFHLTEVLMQLVKSGVRMRTFNARNWFDCGKKDILLETNAKLLKTGGYKLPDQKAYLNAILIPPVYIGEGCDISDSVIGPNVSIGDHTKITYSIIKNSIIGSQSSIEMAAMDHSVIGNHSSLKGVGLSLNLGDSTEINLG